MPTDDEWWEDFGARRKNRRDDPPILKCKKCKKNFEASYIDTSKGGYWFVRRKYCNTCWRGEVIHKDGYIYRKVNGRYKSMHRINMEEKLGRKLHKWETVHHIDGNRSNNKIENLELWSTRHGKGIRVSDRDKDNINDYILGALSLC